MKQIEVVAAIIHDAEGRIFATQRGYGEWEGWWEFPGGKMEVGESAEQALQREIWEELETRIVIERLVATVEWDYPAFHLTMHCYWCHVESGSLTLKEHEAARWLAKEELESVKWLPADLQILEKIRNIKDNMKLSNDIIAIEVAEHGAELVSLKKDGREYLWTGDAAYWNRHAPILFPAVGKPYNNELHVDGKIYPMKQHGYARDSEFEVIGDGRLRMKESNLSANYPFRLGLEVCYRLEGSTVEVVWTVENRDEREAYFQIGAHPGFLLPEYQNTDKIHGYIRYYDREGKLVHPIIVNGLEEGNRVPLTEPLHVDSLMPLTKDTFAHDALMFEGGQVIKAELWDKHLTTPILSVSCQQAEAYGIWAPHKEGCSFVCLEPWCGICDTKGFTADISERQYIHHLAPKETYSFTYTIALYA